MLTAPYCCPAFDRAFSALLDDLHQRGMLDDTLVVVTGEFGRTPKMNKNAGRDHWSPCYSIALAGGGVQGGQVYGASDRQAAYVQESPVRPEDVGATVLHAFGLAPETAVYDLSNRPVRASKGQPITDLFG
jgi:arylsulfatase A-like enzyme